MNDETPKSSRLALPKRLLYAALRFTVAGALACSGQPNPGPPGDAGDAADAGDVAEVDACYLSCAYAGPDVADAATCPPLVCNPADCVPPCQILV